MQRCLQAQVDMEPISVVELLGKFENEIASLLMRCRLEQARQGEQHIGTSLQPKRRIELHRVTGARTNATGCAMSQNLPHKSLKFEKDTARKQIWKRSDDIHESYIVELDLEFSQHRHDKVKQIPPFLESLTPNIDWFFDLSNKRSERQRFIHKRERQRRRQTRPTLAQA